VRKVKDLIDFYYRIPNKEQRDELEKDYLFRRRYKLTFNAIGERRVNEDEYNTYTDEE